MLTEARHSPSTLARYTTTRITMNMAVPPSYKDLGKRLAAPKKQNLIGRDMVADQPPAISARRTCCPRTTRSTAPLSRSRPLPSPPASKWPVCAMLRLVLIPDRNIRSDQPGLTVILRSCTHSLPPSPVTLRESGSNPRTESPSPRPGLLRTFFEPRSSLRTRSPEDSSWTS